MRAYGRQIENAFDFAIDSPRTRPGVSPPPSQQADTLRPTSHVQLTAARKNEIAIAVLWLVFYFLIFIFSVGTA